MKRILLFLFVCIASYTSLSQNLVPNPSFEDTVFCDGSGDINQLKHWINPTSSTPDYFCNCHSGNFGVPVNSYGNQMARTGRSYIGLVSVLNSSFSREYVQVKLTSPLISGFKYKVEFYVCVSDSSQYSVNNLGAYFSSNSVSSANGMNLNYLPQVLNSSAVDKLNTWCLISGVIIANGGEEYLTIGNFNDNNNTDTSFLNGSQWAAGYMYIDDVSVTKEMSCNENGITYPNVFTPNNDGKNDFWYPDGDLSGLASLYIINRWGNEVANLTGENSFCWDGKSKNNEIITTGVYYIIEEKKNCPLKNVGFVHLIK